MSLMNRQVDCDCDPLLAMPRQVLDWLAAWPRWRAR